MNGCCGIDIDRDRIAISLAAFKKLQPVFLQQDEIRAAFDGDNLIEFLKNKGEDINTKIKEGEKRLSVYADKIYLNLPWGLARNIVVEANVPLKKMKKIDWHDISFAKKYLQDACLEWGDVCVHHLVLNYGIDESTYMNPPIGVVAKKIKIKSLLVAVKDKLRKDVEDIFNNLERKFAGFVSPELSILTTAFAGFDKEASLAAVDVGYDRTHIILYQKGMIDFIEKPGFGLKKMLEDLAHKLLLPLPLAEEVFNRYVSFKDTPYTKEVSVKNGETYVNLSTHTVNSFMSELMKNECNLILAEIKDKVSAQTSLAFTGRLNAKEGLDALLKECAPYAVKLAPGRQSLSSSFGCIKYGVSKFLENDYQANSHILRHIAEVYREYF